MAKKLQEARPDLAPVDEILIHHGGAGELAHWVKVGLAGDVDDDASNVARVRGALFDGAANAVGFLVDTRDGETYEVLVRMSGPDHPVSRILPTRGR